MALTDENTGVVDRLGKTELVNASLKTALQEVLDLEGQDVIELHAGFVEHTDADETTNEGVTFEKALRVLLVKGQERTVQMLEICTAHCQKMAIERTGQHDGSWRGSTGRARPRACCADHTRRRASAQYP